MKDHFDALVYDLRDVQADTPSSMLGEFETVTEAWQAIIDYLKKFPDISQIYRAEIRKVIR